MTRLLASVTGPHEAALAMSGGADIIDLKDPSRGILGAVAHEVQREVVERVNGRCPVSATVGDLPMNPEIIVAAIRDTARNGVDLVKIGLRNLERHPDCLDALAEATGHGIRVVAVLFAEDRPSLHLHGSIRDAGCHGVMLDTADKATGRLVRYMDMHTLGGFVSSARRLGLLTGLAGSLQPGDISELRRLGPDYLGFRGALCQDGARTGRLSASALARVRRLLDSTDDDCAGGRLMAN
jgi:dihydroneopterin aldolase